MGLYFSVGADFEKLKQLKKDIDDLKSKLEGMDKKANPKEFEKLEKQLIKNQDEYKKLGTRISQYVAKQEAAKKATLDTNIGLDSMHKMLLKLGGTTALIGLGKQIIDVRNEFQQLEISFGTMLKSEEKAAALMKDLSRFAATTPFGLQSAASGAKQLLAYGSTADTVIKELTMLGDVAAGTGQQIGDLVYLYGTLRTQGRAYLMDIRQFAGRGIPIYDELAKVLNISKDKVNDFVSAGKVGFKEVEQAFKNMTSQGGLYGGLMEKQSASIGGRLEELKDNIDAIFNTIGKDNEGIIYKSINGLNTLVANYDKVGKLLVGLIATYGAYRTALMVNYIATQSFATSQMQLGVILARVQKGWQGLTAVMLKNPYVAAATALVGLVTVVWALHDATTTQEKAQERLNEINEKAAEYKQNLENETQKLIGTINSETKTLYDQVAAYKELQGKYPNILANMDMQTFKTMSLTEQIKLLNQALNDLDSKNLDAEIERQEKIVQNIVDGFKTIRDSGAASGQQRQLEIQTQILDNLKKQRQEKLDMLKETEFLALSEKDRERILQNQLTSLDIQKKYIEDQISSIASVYSEWNKFNPLFFDLNNQLRNVLKQIESTKNKLVENPSIKNKSFWEKQKKDAEEALGLIESSQLQLLKKGQTKGIDPDVVEKYKKAAKDLSEANKNLGLYDFSNKSSNGDKEKQAAADKAKAEAEKVSNELLKQQEKLNLEKYELEKIGIEDRIALLQMEGERKIAEIEKEKNELLKQDSNADTSVYDERAKTASELYKKLIQAEKQNLIDKEDQFLIEWNRRFGNILQQRQAIVDDYNKKIADSQGVNEKKLLESERDEALQKFDAKIAESSDLMTRLFADAAKMSVSEIKKIIKETEILLDLIRKEKTNTGSVTEDDAKVMGFSLDEIKALGGSIEDLDRILDALNGKKDALADSSPFESFKSDIDSSIDKIKKGFEEGSAKGIGSGVEGIGSGIQNFLPTLQKFSSDLGEIFGESFGESMDGFVKGLEALAETGQGVGKLLQGDISGILDVASGMAKIVGHSKRVNKEHREALKILERQREELEHMYAIAQLRASLEYKMKETVFGSDGWGKARNAADVYKQSVDKLKGSLKKLEDVDVVTGSKKSGWGFWKKRKDVWTDLLKAYPELIDRNGKFDKSLAQTILSTRKLTDEGKEFVQRAIDNAELVEDAYSNMKEYLTGIFGDLGNSITDAFVQAFENGADAFDLMRKSAADMIEQLAKEMVYSVTLDPLMDKYSKQMMDIASNLDLSDEDQFNRYMDIIDNLVDQAILQQGKANDLLQSAQDRAKEKGYEIFDGDSKSQNSTKGYSVAMDQDTGGAILGRVTGIHETDLRIEDKVLTLSSHTSELVNQVMRVGDHAKETMESIEEIKNIQLHSYYELKDINKNTSRLHEMSDTLESINSNIKDLLS